jgi:hypothetical protein
MSVVSNWGQAVITSFGNALNLLLTFIPKLLGFLVILIVGLIVATVVAKILTVLLRKIGFDRMANRIGLTRLEQSMNIHLDAAGLLGKVVYWFILLIFIIPAIDALGLTTVSAILSQIIAYIPNVFVAILVLFLGAIAATFVADIIRGAMSSARASNAGVFAGIARWAIIGFAALIALEQLRIAPALIEELFAAVVGAAAIAFGLAFGLGGQDAARRWLARGEESLTTAASQVKAQQQTQQMRQQSTAQPTSYSTQSDMQQPNYNPALRGQQPTASASYTQPYSEQQGNNPYTQPFGEDPTQRVPNPNTRPPTR